MRRPPGTPPPRPGTGADGQSGDQPARQGTQYPHRPQDGATSARLTLGEVLRRRAAHDAQPKLAYLGTPARKMAGKILSGDKMCFEIAHELVGVRGTTTAAMLAEAIDAEIRDQAQEQL